MLEDIFSGLRSAADQTSNIGEKTLITVALILIVWLLIKVMRIVLHRIIPAERIYFLTQRTIFWILTLGTVVLIGLIWFKALNFLVFGTGALIALVGLAMKDLVLNIIGFAFIEFKRPFKIGDRVQIGDSYGDVRDIQLFQFALIEVEGDNRLSTKNQTGRTVYIPNREIFLKPLINDNYEFKFVWTDITVPITHQSNVDKTKQILGVAAKEYMNGLLEEASEKDLQRFHDALDMFDSTKAPGITMTLDGSGIDITLRFLCPHNQIAKAQSMVWEDVHRRIQLVDDIAYSPTVYRIYQSGPDSPIS
ncbi:MAG: mechanosensitive ion channel [Actinomycetaceae bacterium]|nr:mechanosensitive ion channel [Actinomycetaceae bacterium]